MMQGISKEEIFKGNENKQKYLQIIMENIPNYQLSIIAYCIMDNHTHILVKVPDVTELSKFMRNVNTTYAMFYNKKNSRVGYVFRNRYKSQEIRNKEHLYKCIEYIHNNPVKAGLCADQSKYEYSSFIKMYGADRTRLYQSVGRIMEGANLRECNAEENNEFAFLEEKIDKKTDNRNLIIDKLNEQGISPILASKKENREKLKEVVHTLKVTYGVSYREMESIIGVSRETLRQLDKKG